MPKWAVERVSRMVRRRVAERRSLGIEASSFVHLSPSAKRDVQDSIAEALTDDPMALIATWNEVKRAFGHIDPRILEIEQ